MLVGTAIGWVVLATALFGYKRPVVRWELVLRPHGFEVVPVKPASDGRDRGDDDRAPSVLDGPLSQLAVRSVDDGVVITDGTRDLRLPVSLSDEAGLRSELAQLAERYGDASMVPDTLGHVRATALDS